MTKMTGGYHSAGFFVIVTERTGSGYRFRFDEARTRYLVKLFGGGRPLQTFRLFLEADTCAPTQAPRDRLISGDPRPL